MTDNWQPGDLALCLKHGNWRWTKTDEEVSSGPRAGQIISVFFVGCTETAKLGRRVTLGFKEWPGDQFVADNFAKIYPLVPEIEDDEPSLLRMRQQIKARNEVVSDGDTEEEARAWARSIGQAKSNVLQSLVRARDRRGEFATREAFHRAMLEARNFKGKSLECALRRKLGQDTLQPPNV